MENNIREAYSRILHAELIAAMGCTEPIAIAYAAAMARETLGRMPEHCLIDCSVSIHKVFVSQSLFHVECGCVNRDGIKKRLSLCAVCDTFDIFELFGNFEAHTQNFFVAER